MRTPVDLMIRRGFDFLARKLVPEVFVSGLATLLVMALFSAVMKATPLPSRTERARLDQSASVASNERTADFMERVALSHVGGVKRPSAATAAAPMTGRAVQPASVSPAVRPVRAATASPPASADAAPKAGAAFRPRQPAPPSRRGSPPAVRVQAGAVPPDVLPPPRPTPETIVPAAVSKPAKAKALRPLQYGVRLVTKMVDFVPASGTRVVEAMASVGDALSSFAKKL